jgi:hypothetical protein
MSCTLAMYHKANTRVYHLREQCNDWIMKLEKVTSAEQVADSLTKAMPVRRRAFSKHRAVTVMLGHTGTGEPVTLTYM